MLLTQTERLMMSGRPKHPKYARNKNVIVIGGSGSGKTRFFVKPNLMQMPEKVSYVCTDPKGTIIIECGKMLSDAGYKIKVLNTINFKKSMIEIYLYTSLAPIPFATMSNREWGHVGTNYFRGLFALAFQAFLMMVCVAIYAALISSVRISSNMHSALIGVAAYTVILCFSLMKTGSLSKQIFGSH